MSTHRLIAMAIAGLGLLNGGCGDDEHCSLDTLYAECAAQCWTGPGPLPGTGSPDYPCGFDPICRNGSWYFQPCGTTLHDLSISSPVDLRSGD